MLNFVLVDNGESYRTGKILETVIYEGGYFLVQFDNMSDKTKKLPAEMVHISEMLSMNGEFKAWSFFATAEALQEWLDEIESPAAPRIVSLVKK